MSETDEIRIKDAARWFAIADRDVRTAEHDLTAQPPFLESAAYYCQQACEKLLKGCLVGAGKPFPYSHDLGKLAHLVVLIHPALEDMLFSLQKMTVWGTAYRYPFEEEQQTPLTVDKIKAALSEIAALRKALGADKV